MDCGIAAGNLPALFAGVRRKRLFPDFSQPFGTRKLSPNGKSYTNERLSDDDDYATFLKEGRSNDESTNVHHELTMVKCDGYLPH